MIKDNKEVFDTETRTCIGCPNVDIEKQKRILTTKK